MTNSSPIAQEVVNAAVDVTGYGRATPLMRLRLAAAIRAAAVYCRRDRLHLLSIADEVEALSDD